MIFLLLIEAAMALCSFMLSPLNAAFPFEIITPVYTFLNYVADGLKLVVFFCFDSWVLRSVFSFFISINVLFLGLDLVWRILGYVKLKRDN